nr:hypothetical protein CFP56_23382 [Quercus suber]
MSKRKSEGKDDRTLKKGPTVPTGDKPKKSSPLKPSHRVGKGLMTSTSLITQGSVRHLLTHKEHAVELKVVLFVGTGHMKAFQNRSVAKERVTSRLRKRNETLTNKQKQYKEALCTLNKEVKELTKKLKEEGAKREKEQQAK